MYIHDVIKMKYVNIGFLPNYPYYLISDSEMFDAFLKEDGFFDTYYPCPSTKLTEAYNALHSYIVQKISDFQLQDITLPDWVYSYMIMQPITYQSDEADIAYICDMANLDNPNILSEFTEQLALTCYVVSKKWLQKQPDSKEERPPTMFGETHVIKSLRLNHANVLLDADFYNFDGDT